MKSIDVKLTRAEKRGRKIILVIESDLYSDEVFAVTPFYDEGDKKNQLQEIRFNINVMEKGGIVCASVNFDSCLSHFTKGYSQLHKPLTKFYLTRKDCARDYFLNEERKYFTDDRILNILKLWELDKAFHKELFDISEKRKRQFIFDDLNEAKENYKKALEALNENINKMSDINLKQ